MQDKSENLNSVRTSKVKRKNVICDWNPCLMKPLETLKIQGEQKLTLIDHHSRGKMQLIVECIWLPLLCAMKTLKNEKL